MTLAVPDDLVDVFWAVGLVVGFYALFLWLRRSRRSSRRRSASAGSRASSSRRTATTASRSSRCGTTRASSSPRPAARSSPTASSPARRSSAATRSATRRSSTRCSRSSGASRTRAVGASRCSARRREFVPRCRASACARFRSGAKPCCGRRTFSLEGRAIRKVRQSVSRLTKAGLPVPVVVGARDADRAELDAVSAAWRGERPERGFSMAIDDLYAPGMTFAVAEGPDGRVGGFLHLAPSPASGLVAQHDAPAAGDAERPRRVPGRRDARVGEGDGRDRALAQLLRARRLRRARGRGDAPAPRRSAARSSPPTASSSSSGCTRSAASSIRPGGRAISAWRSSAISRSSASPTSGSSSSFRRHRGAGGPPCHTEADGTGGDEKPRAPVGDRAGHGAARLRLLPRGAQAHGSAAGAQRRDAARGDVATRPGRLSAAGTCASCSTSSGRRS